MRSFFITGTDTEIGKTFVACAMIDAFRRRGVRVAPMKPIAAGTVVIDGVSANEDVHQLLAAYGAPMDPLLVNPYCFAEPIAPHIAAKHESRTIDLAVIRDAFKRLRASHDSVLVEGAGGFLVPMSSTASMAALPTELDLDVVLVVGMRLGCLNHALLTAEAIRARGLRLAAWVANTVDSKMSSFDENIETLKQQLNAPCLGVLPRVQGAINAAAQDAASLLDVEPLVASDV
jgi:dethiobiotin synthetase